MTTQLFRATFLCQQVWDDTVRIMYSYRIGQTEAFNNLLVVYTSIGGGYVQVQLLIGGAESLQHCVYIPVFFPGGDKTFRFPIRHCLQKMVIESEVRPPMDKLKLFFGSFSGC